MTGNISAMRLTFASQPLGKNNVLPDPIDQFGLWIDQAAKAELFQANAMTLATTSGGRPSARMVLLDEFDKSGFVFYTSYASRKGEELAENPWAALVFWWGPLFRQVRIEGKVSRLDDATCEKQFATRPREHQLETWAFQQSQVIQDRDTLRERIQALEVRFGDHPIPRPDDFGGYRLEASRMDFWQGRQDWLHDSLRYTRQNDGRWNLERLAP